MLGICIGIAGPKSVVGPVVQGNLGFAPRSKNGRLEHYDNSLACAVIGYGAVKHSARKNHPVCAALVLPSSFLAMIRSKSTPAIGREK